MTPTARTMTRSIVTLVLVSTVAVGTATAAPVVAATGIDHHLPRVARTLHTHLDPSCTSGCPRGQGIPTQERGLGQRPTLARLAMRTLHTHADPNCGSSCPRGQAIPALW
jgi:Cu/Zn superoxide dismutase